MNIIVYISGTIKFRYGQKIKNEKQNKYMNNHTDSKKLSAPNTTKMICYDIQYLIHSSAEILYIANKTDIR